MEKVVELSLDDLGEVLEELLQVRSKWYYVGIKLKVPVDTLEGIKTQYDDPMDQLREMLKPWLKRAAKSQPTWSVLVEMLRSSLVEEPKMADELEAKHCPAPGREQEIQGAVSAVKSRHLIQLKSRLETLQSIRCAEEESRNDMKKAAIEECVTQSLQVGVSEKEMQEELQKLHADFLIPKTIYKWAQQIVTEVYAESLVFDENSDAQLQKEAHDVLFCKDTVYHAGICNLALNTCDAGNYQKLFKDKQKVPGHSFQALSISRSKQNRYLIATQGNSTHYFAFESLPHFSQWPQQYKSFGHGIKLLTDKFPVRLIIELLTSRQRVVLTGFSFGGLLACSIAACIWNAPYIPSSLLKQNLACITFGQPHISVPLLQEVSKERPDLPTTIHSIYIHDDIVPRLSRFLNECCTSDGDFSRPPSILLKAQEQLKISTESMISLLFEYMGKVQKRSDDERKAQPGTTLPQLKSLLSSIATRLSTSGDATYDAKQFSISTTPYLISCDASTGLVWGKMTKQQAIEHSSYPQVAELDNIDSDLFAKYHSMSVYCQKMSWAYLDKSPLYSFPEPVESKPLVEISTVKPSVVSAELHHHGSEVAVALEGKNLWFCYRVTVGGHSVDIPAGDDISGSSIQFNVAKESNKIEIKEEMVKVVLHNYFSSKPARQDVAMHQKEYPVTSRQQQLAKLTPSKLIELGYLCALLQQHPKGKFQPHSHKVEVIGEFLEEVVRVVPLESAGYAILHKRMEIAQPCVKALKCSHLVEIIATSDLMVRGLLRMQLELPNEGTDPDAADCNDLVTLQDIATTEFTWSQFSERFHSLLTTTPIAELKFQFLDRALAAWKKGNFKLLCGMNIEQLYPMGHKHRELEFMLPCPLDILRNGRKSLSSIMKKAQTEAAKSQETSGLTAQKEEAASLHNAKMLETVNNIRDKELAICTNLLGGFMEQQEIDIPLVKSRRDRAQAISLSGAASVGVWALSSLNFSDIQPLLSQCHSSQLLVKIESYVKAIFSAEPVAADDDQYAAKLQFMAQGMTKTVTCNSQYVSYSLERQLSELCNERRVDTAIPLDELVAKWGMIFKESILSLVAVSHRPLIARWLKWALMVHNLREELAKYTTVGVAGLVNSGKSKLISSLFDIAIPHGTKEAKRTTVPFIYDLDEVIKGLDIADFPGVDDQDETIPDLANLLLTIAQIVIFVVDYRKIHTGSAKKWLEKLQIAGVPVLVCLTFADKLYAEHMSADGKHPDVEDMKFEIDAECSMIRRKISPALSRTVRFFSFSQDNDSVLNSEKGRKSLRDVGIGTSLEVGDWLVDVFRKRFGQEELADQLHSFMRKPSSRKTV